MFLGRERLVGLGNDLTSASAASIDARMDRHFFGPVFPVELRTDADFHIIAAPEQRHESSAYAPSPWPRLRRGPSHGPCSPSPLAPEPAGTPAASSPNGRAGAV